MTRTFNLKDYDLKNYNHETQTDLMTGRIYRMLADDMLEDTEYPNVPTGKGLVLFMAYNFPSEGLIGKWLEDNKTDNVYYFMPVDDWDWLDEDVVEFLEIFMGYLDGMYLDEMGVYPRDYDRWVYLAEKFKTLTGEETLVDRLISELPKEED